MTTTLPEPLSRPRTVLLTAVFGGTLLAGAWMVHRGIHVGTLQNTPTNGAQLFDDVLAHLQTQYIDTLSDAQMYRMAVDGMVAELHDPYSVFLTPDRLSRLSEHTSGNYAGIGLQVDIRDGVLMVVSPLPGGPGERAGIMTGDRIVEIDGKTMHGWTPEEVQRLLRGAPGSAVKLTVEHAGNSTPITVTLTRAPIHQSAVRHAAMLANNVAYVDLKVFSDSAVTELERTIDSLVQRGARALIVDVRASPGGLLAQGVRAADLFLSPGQRIVRTRGRIPEANREYVDQKPPRWPQLMVAVLVDERTASAAEIFAGALQDHDRAVVVGLTTYGKGSAQNVYPLDSAGALKLTTARWFTPVGRSISRIAPSDDDDAGGTTRRSPKEDSAARHPQYKTDAGRTIYGGGGITPDVVIGDTAATPENVAFMHALGRKVGLFRDALASHALAAKASHAVQSPTFTVTPAMLDDVYRRMVARGVDVPHTTYDEASPLVARLLGYEVARYVFGTDAEFERKAMDDRMLITAQRLVSAARSESEVLTRAASLANALSKARQPAR